LELRVDHQRNDAAADDALMVLHVAQLVSVTSAIALVGAVLPRDDVVIWPWVGAGVATALTVVCFWTRVLGRRRRVAVSLVDHGFALVATLVAYGSCACFAYGLSGKLEIYRVLFFGPLVLMATMGTRPMRLVSAGACLASLTAVTYGLGYPLSSLPAFVVANGAVIVLVCGAVHHLAHHRMQAAEVAASFVELSLVAAKAETTDEGLPKMLPAAAKCLSASSLVAYQVVNRIVSPDPIASWPEDGVPHSEADMSSLRIAAVDRKIVLGTDRCYFPASDDAGVAMVLVAGGIHVTALTEESVHRGAERVAAQLEVLLTRLGLVARLEGLSRCDSLTNLPNRRSLNERLTHDLAVAARTGSPLSVAMIDLDHFKSYNDTFGHRAGDDLLVAFSQMCGSRIRSSDFVARYGGEEFCLVLPATACREATILFNELHRRCASIDEALRPVTFSAGVAEWDGTESAGSLIERADRALYAAKDGGRARTVAACEKAAADEPFKRTRARLASTTT